LLTTILFITFLFNGEVRDIHLASTTPSQCIGDAVSALTVLDNLGATVISAFCTFEGEYE
jgi:hypothetical protein